ncbi:MAG: hypothetical protein M1375_03640 [Candidatus Thermoplasmatota archaeon]|jgi:hypothetical protein|nr:hypothetical protein [Candidatus Thermoplasmatota archaeon]MCL5791045.1 hypothetical protein [Candidatus Thermoplasmatota archaeon]
MPVIDRQMKMKLQAEMAYVSERLEQIKQNRDSQGINREEEEVLQKRKKDIMNQLY